MKLLPALVMLAGCGVAVYTSAINPPPRPLAPRDPRTVEVYTGGPPPRPRIDLALFTADLQGGTGAFSDPFTTELDSLRQQAGQMGCDALLVQRTSTRTMVATCTVWMDSAPTAPPPAAPPPTALPPAPPQ
jgi:hypothetical protein